MSQQVKTTARDIIRRAMKSIAALGEGENPSSNEANDALLILNEIVDKWNIETLMIPAMQDIEFNLTNKKMYTIGDTGDINTIHPATGILGAYYKFNGISYPLAMITEGQYNDIVLKDLMSTIPQYVKYRATNPLGELIVYPICNQGSIVLNVNGQFNAFSSLDSIIDLPSGYIKALRTNLAIELGIEFGRQSDPRLEAIAVSAKNQIKITNSAQKPWVMSADAALLRSGSGFNIYSGE